MDVPAERSTRTAGPHPHLAARHDAGSRRRRPTGEPPPLPHHLQTSGVRWLVATLVLVALAIVVFARGLHGLAVDVAVFDAAVVGWLGGIDLPGFRALMRGLAALSSWWVLNPVAYGLIVVLLVLRRFRHLIIWLVLTNVLSNIGGGIIGPVAQRPRPFGAVIREGWGGWAMPPLHVSFFAIGLVAALAGCSTAPYHGEYTRGGQAADYKGDREECREVAKKKATEEFYGQSWSTPWFHVVEKNTLVCMNERGYEWVKKE